MSTVYENRNRMVELYLAGASAEFAAACIGRGKDACYEALKLAGITGLLRNRRGAKYQVNLNYFDVIDTQDKAYWLGFITADGWLSCGKLYIELQSKDREHLEKFKKAIEFTGPIMDRTQKNSCKHHKKDKYFSSRILVSSKQIVDSLIELGLTENKSLTVTECEQVPEHLLSHYYRGIFDGDGNYGISGKYPQLRVRLVATLPLINSFRKFIARNNVKTESKPRLKHKNSEVYEYELGGNILAPKVMNLLFKDAETYLDRKYNFCKQVLEGTN